MKKLIILAGVFAFGIYFSACNNGGNADQANKDKAAIDSMVTSWNKMLTDSLTGVCMADARAKGMAMGDSMVTASKKGGKKTTSTTKTTTTTTTTKTDTNSGPVGNKGNNTTNGNPVGTKGGTKNADGTTTNPVGTKGKPKN
ncbi:MAG TPA: hypothetical protein DCQ93_02545 [Bacteroidetes bacterium]|nr:hypothetical protein [Bacteroidota bacterium]